MQSNIFKCFVNILLCQVQACYIIIIVFILTIYAFSIFISIVFFVDWLALIISDIHCSKSANIQADSFNWHFAVLNFRNTCKTLNLPLFVTV